MAKSVSIFPDFTGNTTIGGKPDLTHGSTGSWLGAAITGAAGLSIGGGAGAAIGATTAKKESGNKLLPSMADTKGTTQPEQPTQTAQPEQPTQTDENEDENGYSLTGVGFDQWADFYGQQQQKQWAREDAIRKETQEREDNAYQRAVEDMRKAGINPNLVGVTPSSSGGGITNATGFDSTGATSGYATEIDKAMKEIELQLKESGMDQELGIAIMGSIVSLIGEFGGEAFKTWLKTKTNKK